MSDGHHSESFMRTKAPVIGDQTPLEELKKKLAEILTPGTFLAVNLNPSDPEHTRFASFHVVDGPAIGLASGKVLEGGNLKGTYVGDLTVENERVADLAAFLLSRLGHDETPDDVYNQIVKLSGHRHPDFIQEDPAAVAAMKALDTITRKDDRPFRPV